MNIVMKKGIITAIIIGITRSAKMVAAVITALMNALFMIVGFAFYMMGMMGSATAEMSTAVNGIWYTSPPQKTSIFPFIRFERAV